MTCDFQHLNRLDGFLQYLLLGQHQSVSDAIQSLPTNDPVAIWLRLVLRQGLPTSVESALPSHYAEQWRGWRAYYGGNYRLSAQHFSQAWMALDNASITLGKADVALGLGKVYTRTGHWQAARDWLLLSLAVARQQNRLFDIVQGYGALGELLLRGGHPQSAYTCLSNAYHILPPGSGQRPRQLNYLASALLRCGETLRAESLLMTSLHLAYDSNDNDSVWHALARLQFLRLNEGLTQKTPIEDITEALEGYVPSSENTPIALGFLRLGQAVLEYRRGNRVAALSKIQSAKQFFGTPFSYEYWWALKWEAFLTDGMAVVDETSLELLQLEPLLPPPQQVVLDLSWQRLKLPKDNGFMPLTRESLETESLMAIRYLFFI